MRITKKLAIMIGMAAMALAGPPVNVMAEDTLVHAVSPGYDIVIGKDVTFDWYETAWRNQNSFRLYTSNGARTIKNTSLTEYTWEDFPFGSGRWSVSVRATISWIGHTSKQNFYHYNNMPGIKNTSKIFEYKKGARNLAQSRDLTIFYELTKDYSIKIADYFTNLQALPEHVTPLGFLWLWQRTESQRNDLYNHVRNMVYIDGDFMKLEHGVLTLKKGYRWDGTSNPFVWDEEPTDLRSSCIHDALYDMMRMGYLDPDKGVADWDNSGYKNRLVADIMHFMIAVEDGDKTRFWAQSDFNILRIGGQGKTHKDKLLHNFKYRVSGLTAWVSDNGNGVELHWLPADFAQKDPKDYSSVDHTYDIYRAQSGDSSWSYIGSTEFTPSEMSEHKDWTIYYPDDTVDKDEIYYYWIRANDPDTDGDGWTDQEEYLLLNPSPSIGGLFCDTTPECHPPYEEKHHDESDVEAVVVPSIALGNALVLDGYDDYVEANTVSSDLSSFDTELNRWVYSMTLEARVYPEVQTGKSAILAFTTPAGDDFNMLMYDGTNQQFCYYDFVTGYICSDSDSINPGSWYHVAVTIDKDNEGILLVDGVIEAEFTTVVAPPKTAFFSIGQECDGPVGPPENPDGCFPTSQHFKGKIDEVRIWNYDREQTDIESNKDSPMRGYHQGMVALWHFDEPDDIYTAYDATIYSNDGIIFGKATPSCPDVDEVPPVILCNAPEILVPPDVPISFTAMAIDNCDVSSVEITDYDCYKYTQKGKLVDKTDGCVVEFADDIITILDSAGVGTIITWTIIATDSSGNTSEEICEIPVLIPGKNKDVISGSNKVVPPGKNKDVTSGSNKEVPPGKNKVVISGSNKVVPPGKNKDVPPGKNK